MSFTQQKFHSIQTAHNRINTALTELRELSSAFDACDPTDPQSLLRVVTEERSTHCLFLHMELLQLVTFILARWWPDWMPCTTTSSSERDARFLDPRTPPPGTFSSLADDISDTCVKVLSYERISERYRYTLRKHLLRFQEQLTRHSSYCMYFASRAAQGREASRTLQEALTTGS